MLRFDFDACVSPVQPQHDRVLLGTRLRLRKHIEELSPCCFVNIDVSAKYTIYQPLTMQRKADLAVTQMSGYITGKKFGRGNHPA